MNCGNGGGAKGRLSRDLICETALQAIDEVGLEGVSMRMLAGALGVKASSLYYHFESRDELMTGVAEFLYRKLGRPPSGGDWTDQVKGTFVQLRDFIQVHPNAAPLLIRDLADSPVAKKRASVLLRQVCRAGVDPVTSANLLSNLVALLVGHSLLALWVAEKTRTVGGDADGDGKAGDVSRVWVHKLFPAEQPDPFGPETLSPDDGWATGLLLADPGGSTPERTAVGLSATPRTSGLSEASSRDSVFSAGLDALMSGFAPQRN